MTDANEFARMLCVPFFPTRVGTVRVHLRLRRHRELVLGIGVVPGALVAAAVEVVAADPAAQVVTVVLLPHLPVPWRAQRAE